MILKDNHMKDWSDKMTTRLKELFMSKNAEVIRYVIVGACTTFVNLIVFTIMCKICKIDVTISNITSVIVAILFAYLTNKIFVFQSHCHHVSELLREAMTFIGARLVTMVIEVGGVFLLVNVLGQEEVIGKLETQIIVLISNYLISKFLVFKQ